jgi:hypothetical protein
MRLTLLTLVTIANAAAQCVMCNRTAAAQNLARARVLNSGIIILLIPPLLILGGLSWFALRKSKQS